MGKIRAPQKALPFIGILFTPTVVLNNVIDVMKTDFGEKILESEPIVFDQTTYYNKEMGDSIQRQWFVFNRLFNPSCLCELKHITNRLETDYLDKENNRRINIDPGLITMSNVVLASTKNYSHRIYLDKGVYAEVTLLYKHKEFHALDWTYPDYQEPKVLQFFNEGRDLLKERLAKDA